MIAFFSDLDNTLYYGKDIRAAEICGVPAFVCACDYPDGGAVPPD